MTGNGKLHRIHGFRKIVKKSLVMNLDLEKYYLTIQVLKSATR